MRFFSKDTSKLVVSSIVMLISLVWVLYSLSVGTKGFFLGTEPLAITVVIWLSMLVLVSGLWVVSAQSRFSLRTVWLFLAWSTAIRLLLVFNMLGQSLAGVLQAWAWVLVMLLAYRFISIKRKNYQSHRRTSSFAITNVGIGSFGVGMAAVCSLLFSAALLKAPITCEAVYNRYDKAIESPLVPIHRSQQSLESLGEQSVFGVLQSLQEEIPDVEEVEELSQQDSIPQSRWLIVKDTFNDAKKNLVDETLEQRSIVTQNICELVIGQITEIRKKATRNISIVVLLFVILSPLVTLRFRLVGFVGWIVFKILMLLGVYRVKKKLVTVEEIE